MRDVAEKAKRIVIKIGSSSLTGKDGTGLDQGAVDRFVDVVAGLTKEGKEVLVVSSGAIAAGLAPLGLTSRPRDLATQQAAASVGQGLLMHRYTESFGRYGITASQVLLTIEDIVRRSHYKNAQRTLFRLLQLGVVPVINENDSVGTQEIRLGDNDRIAALVSHLVGADLVVLVTDVDALYDAPPSDVKATPIHDVVDFAKLDSLKISGSDSKVGSGGMITKVEAARIATGAGIPLLLTTLSMLESALNEDRVGTLFHATPHRKPSRLLWLAHAATSRGTLVIDDGAVKALRERGVSLLPAGVTQFEGEFASGDTVDVVAANGELIARGLIAFDSEDLPAMLGRSTKELAAELGPEYERELIHRDDLVIL